MKVYNSLSFDNEEDKYDIDIVLNKMKEFCRGVVNETYERYVFNTRTQASNESIDEFYGAKNCSFGELTLSLIKDRIIVGIHDNTTRQKLLSEKGLTLEKCLEIARSSTKSIRIGCWNVRTMFSVGKTAQTVAEAKKCRVKVLGISECRWSGFGRLRTATGETMLYSGRDDNVHQSGAALLLNKETAESLLDWNPRSDRIITARFNSKCIKTTCVQVYAPTNDAEPEVKDEFYEQLQAVIERPLSHDMLVMMGDWNAKVGSPYQGEEGIVGKHALEGDRTDKGERFVNFCALNNLAISSTMFPHKDIHKYTWTSPDGLHKNQIDHIAVNAEFKRSVRDTRACRGADVGSDPNLVITKTKLKLSRVKKTNTTSRKYEISKLNSTDIQKEFVLELRHRFS